MSSTIDRAAKAAHEANRAYCEAIGDFSQPSWEEAPAWQVRSAITGVQAILANPDLTPEQSHEGWCKQKIAEGWRFGSEKDPEKLTHPCLVDYALLPEAQRAKDAIFGAVVRGVLAHYRV